MLKRNVTPELWRTLLEELRDNPDFPRERIALAHGVEPACLEGWYEFGVEASDVTNIAEFVGGGAPLKVLVLMSQVKARAAAAEDFSPPQELVRGFGGSDRKPPKAKVQRTSKYRLSAAWEAAKDDAIESVALKGKSARAARTNTAALLGLTGQMLNLAKPALKRLEEQMNDPSFLQDLSAFGVIALYSKIARMSKDVMECARMADEIEAVLLGDPNILKETESIEGLSDQDALAVIEEAAAAAAIARETGIGGGVAGYTGGQDEDS